MKLNSPRTDPYSQQSKVLDEWRAEGYEEELHILDAQTAKWKDIQLAAQDLHIDRIRRFMDPNVPSESEAFFALTSAKGHKALVKAKYGKDSDPVVLEFLEHADQSDHTNNLSQ